MEGGNEESAEFNDVLREEELQKLSETLRSGWRSTPIPSHGTVSRSSKSAEEACCSNRDKKRDNPPDRTIITVGKYVRVPTDLQPLIGYMPLRQNQMNSIDPISITPSDNQDDIVSENEELGTIRDDTSPSSGVIEVCPTDVLEVTIGFMPEKQNDPSAEQSSEILENLQNDQSTGGGVGGHTDNDNDNDEARNSEYTFNAQTTNGNVQRIFGSLADLFTGLILERENKQSKQLSSFTEKHHRGNKEEDGSVFQLVLLNFPSGMRVYGFHMEEEFARHLNMADIDEDAPILEEEIPSWNIVRENLIAYGLRVAGQIMSKSGWVVCIHTLEQSRQVQDATCAANLVILRTLTLICNLPIYRQLREPKEKVHTLFVSIIVRPGEQPSPEMLIHEHLDGDESHAALRQMFSQDVIVENMHKRDWIYDRDLRPVRGGAQRSSALWESLILAFSKSGDSVVDLTAHTGTSEFVNLADKLGRHALAVEERFG